MRFLLCAILFVFNSTVFAQGDQGQKKVSSQKADSGYFRSFDGTKIYYEEQGRGRPVVLIHGFIVNSNSWKHTVLYTDLIKKGFRVVTLDLRGNGKSDKPSQEQGYADDAEAKDIMGLARYLHLGKYYV